MFYMSSMWASLAPGIETFNWQMTEKTKGYKHISWVKIKGQLNFLIVTCYIWNRSADIHKIKLIQKFSVNSDFTYPIYIWFFFKQHVHYRTSNPSNLSDSKLFKIYQFLHAWFTLFLHVHLLMHTCHYVGLFEYWHIWHPICPIWWWHILWTSK